MVSNHIELNCCGQGMHRDAIVEKVKELEAKIARYEEAFSTIRNLLPEAVPDVAAVVTEEEVVEPKDVSKYLDPSYYGIVMESGKKKLPDAGASPTDWVKQKIDKAVTNKDEVAESHYRTLLAQWQFNTKEEVVPYEAKTYSPLDPAAVQLDVGNTARTLASSKQTQHVSGMYDVEKEADDCVGCKI